jgi:hypothetical protein
MNLPSNDPVILDQPGLPLANSEAGVNGSLYDRRQHDNAKQLDYGPVPPRKTVAISVRCLIRGRGRPMPYPLDEDEGE